MAARTASRLRIGLVTMALVALATIGWQDSPPNGGQSPGPDEPKDAAPTEQAAPARFLPEWEALLPKLDEIKPIPMPEIPDAPPPHEGAMIDIPYVVESPDILVIDVLEALPGRPIEGERMVRPDGTISLDFYGELHVRGLTPRQIKEKLVLHLRKYLPDDVLGLVGEEWPGGEPPAASTPPNRVQPGDLFALPINPDGAIPPGAVAPPEPTLPELPERAGPPAGPGGSKPTAAARGRSRVYLARIQKALPKRPEPLKRPEQPSRDKLRTLIEEEILKRSGPLNESKRPARDEPKTGGDPADKPAEDRAPEAPAARQGGVPHYILIPPADSDRIFVDVAAYNSKVYYVQGDVAAPGRLPITGKESVLDALNHVGGLLPTANETDIRLVRPGRGDKPGKVYKVDLAAIQEKGDPRTNYQVFPGDRVFVGRHPLVRGTLDIDRQVAPSNALIQSLLYYAYALRAINNINQPYTPGSTTETKVKLGAKTAPIDPGSPFPPLSPAEREAVLKAWAEFHRAIVNRPEGAPLDADLIRKGLLHVPASAPAEAPKPRDKPSN